MEQGCKRNQVLVIFSPNQPTTLEGKVTLQGQWGGGGLPINIFSTFSPATVTSKSQSDSFSFRWLNTEAGSHSALKTSAA